MALNTAFGWALAVAALALGYTQWGWPGVALATAVVVFWLLLQFSRAMRVMKNAGRAPVGHVNNAVVLHSKLTKGMTLMQVTTLTRSLGREVAGAPDVYEWADAAGATVRIELAYGRCVSWSLQRPEAPEPGA